MDETDKVITQEAPARTTVTIDRNPANISIKELHVEQGPGYVVNTGAGVLVVQSVEEAGGFLLSFPTASLERVAMSNAAALGMFLALGEALSGLKILTYTVDGITTDKVVN